MILSQYDEDLCWSLYCAYASNPLAELGSFEEFLNKYRTSTQTRNKDNAEPGMNNQQMKRQLDNATAILSGFKPPMKGGG